MQPLAHILVVDDDPIVRKLVSRCLEDAGYRVTALESGDRVLATVARDDIALAVLDLTLPGIDGLTLTRELRARSEIGVIILSGRSETTERIVGLEIGADDYLGKPFEPRELLARVRSVLRRRPQAAEVTAPADDAAAPVYAFERWRLDLARHELRSGERAGDDAEPVALTSGEFALLRVLVEHPNRVLGREQLLDYLHGNDAPAFDRSVDVRIRRLRQKIEADPANPRLIKTVRNGGYMLTATVRRLDAS